MISSLTDAGEKSADPICLCMGRILPLGQMVVPAFDVGFIHGVTVAEQVRTFRGRPFLLDKHYDRWSRGLELLRLTPPMDCLNLGSTIQHLLDHNARLLPSPAEQGICFFSTPGEANLGWRLPTSIGATLSAYTYPLPLEQHKQFYRSGVSLVSTSIRDVPQDCWPQLIKIRSRMHYYLAQQQAQSASAMAHPILLDHDDFVSDSAIASIVGWNQGEGLIVRPSGQRYSSISLEFMVDLAKHLGLAITERLFTLADLKDFSEAFLVSTPWCMYPVAQVDATYLRGYSLGFPMFAEFSRAWETRVGHAIFATLT